MASEQIDGPDFICIGMQKAGTGWLFDQVQYHPDFWMPPVKELNYLLEDPSRLRNVRQRMKQMQDRPKKRGPRDERDVQFLDEASSLQDKPRDMTRYASLFRLKNGLLSGDITPAYSELEDDVIAEFGKAFPNTKVLLIIRDPVERAWSHISEFHRHERFDAGLLENPDAFRRYLETDPKIVRRSFATRTLRRWSDRLSENSFRWFFFDDVADEPDKTRGEMFLFIGADPGKKSGEFEAGYNRKASNAKLELTDRARAVLVDHFRDELRAGAESLGGHAKKWASYYGV